MFTENGQQTMTHTKSPFYIFNFPTIIIWLFTTVYIVTCEEPASTVATPTTNPLASAATTVSPKNHHHREGGNTRLDTSAELVLGTFAQEQENAWFYETYYPIVLKLKIPDWSPDAHRLNRSSPRCENDDLTPNYLCPTQQHLDNLLVRLSHSTRFFKNIYTASLFSTAQDDKIYDDNPSCVKIRPHFYHFSTTIKGMDPYIEEMRKKCPLAKDLKMIEKSISSSDIDQASVRHAYERFTKLHNANKPKFVSTRAAPSVNSTNTPTTTNTNTNSPSTNFTQQTSKSKLKKDASWELAQMAGYTTFQNAFTLFTYADSVRWANAFATCQSYRLDINLIPPQMLINILDEASRNMTRLGLGYNISIPFDRLLTHFYKLPLTDCVLAIEGLSDAYLVLRLLIPVTRYFKHYKLMKLNKVPFFIRNTRHEHREIGSICEIKNYRYEEMFLVEYDTSMRGDTMPLITSVMKSPPTCGPYHVCRIPDSVHRNLVDSCVEGIISRDEDVTKDECGFKCYPVSRKQMMEDFPYVIQLTSNRYAIVGAMANETKGLKVSIKCFGRTRVDGLKQEKLDEATIITLPCPCHIAIGEAKYYPEYPCNGTLEIIHVTHVVGDGYDGFQLFEGGDKSKRIQDTMNGSKRNNKEKEADGAAGDKKILPDDDVETKEPEEEYVVDDEALFSIPFADNRRHTADDSNSSSADDILVVYDATGGDGYVCVHVIVWILGFMLMFSNIGILYALYQKGYVSMDRILFMR